MSRGRRGPVPPTPTPELEPPDDLRAVTLEHGRERLLMLSFALTETEEQVPEMTQAELEVLRILLSGASNAAIAVQRGTATRTVANQVAALFRKFGVSSRLELARRASMMRLG